MSRQKTNVPIETGRQVQFQEPENSETNIVPFNVSFGGPFDSKILMNPKVNYCYD